MVKDYINPIFAVYLIVLGCVHAFSITQLVTLPLLFAIILGAYFILFNYCSNINTRGNLLFIVITFSFPPLIGMLYSFEYISSVTLNHLLSYIATPILFYFIPRQFLSKNNLNTSLNFLKIGWLIFCAYAIIEFYIANFTDFDINSYIVRPGVEEYEPMVFGLLVRARSFAEESAHAALFAGVMFLVLLKNEKLRLHDIVLFSISFTLFWGTASIVALFISLSSAIFNYPLRYRLKAAISSGLIICAIYMLGMSFGFDVFGDILSKFNSASSEDRLDRIDESIELINNSGLVSTVFGMGPGYYVGAGVQSVVGLYFLSIFQGGILAILLLLCLFAYYFILDYKRGGRYRAALLFAFLCYGSISNYWLPWIWIIFALVDIQNKSSERV